MENTKLLGMRLNSYYMTTSANSSTTFILKIFNKHFILLSETKKPQVQWLFKATPPAPPHPSGRFSRVDVLFVRFLVLFFSLNYIKHWLVSAFNNLWKSILWPSKNTGLAPKFLYSFKGNTLLKTYIFYFCSTNRLRNCIIFRTTPGLGLVA